MNEVWDSQAVGDETSSFNWEDFADRGFDSLDRWLGRYGGSYNSSTYPNGTNKPDVGVNISIWVWVLIAIGLLVFLKGKR